MQIISKYYGSVIRCHRQPSVYTFVWLTLMKVLISLLMRSLSSAFFSLHLWPEYLWKIWMMETIPFSSSDMLSSKVCSRQVSSPDVLFKNIFFIFSLGKTLMFHTFIGDSGLARRGSPAESSPGSTLNHPARLQSTLISIDETHGCFHLSCAA